EERFGVVERQGSWGGAREPSAGRRAVVVLEYDGDGTDLELEGHVIARRCASEDERRAERGMAGERDLGAWCEDADAGGAAMLGREHEGGLGQVQLAREGLHGVRVEVARIGEYGEGIAGER